MVRFVVPEEELEVERADERVELREDERADGREERDDASRAVRVRRS